MITSIDKRIPFLKALRHRQFTLLWSGQFISTLGDGLFRIALAWTVLQLTGSALAMGAVFFASLVPTIAFALLGGVAADRLPRRLIMLCSDAGRGVIVALVAVLALGHLLQFWHLVVLSLLFGIADGFFTPSYQSIIPQLVKDEALQPANALIQSSSELSRLLGPVLGAIVLAVTGGQSAAFALDSLSFFVSAGCLIALRLPPPTADAQSALEDGLAARTSRLEATGSVLTDIRAGLSYVLKAPWLWITILLTAVSNVTFSAPFAAVLPKLVHDFYQAGPALFGVLVGADAAGFLAASLMLGFLHLRRRGVVAYSTLLLSCAGLAVLGLPLPHVYAPVIAAAACICTGLGIGTYTVLTMTLLQELVPDVMMGRVMSIDMAGSFLLLPIGLFLVGGLADHIGPAPVFMVGGGVSLLLAAAGLCIRSIRDLE